MAITNRRQPRKDGSLSTIEDVARLAGVSTATVSRYVNNPEVVAKKSGDKVKAAIAELNYVPNALAGGLASSSRQTVAIFVPYLAHSIIEETIDQLVERLSAAGTVSFVGVTGQDHERTQASLIAALSRRVSALITTGPIAEPARSLLKASATTVVEMWGLSPEPVDIAIGFSHTEVGRALAEFAHGAGYKRPHLVTAKGTRAQRRREGFVSRWEELGGTIPTEDEVPIPSHYGHAAQVLANIEALPQRPDVVITGSDMLAHGLILEATKKGLRVPQDMAVVGFGDIGLSAHVDPAITTVRIDGTRIAERTLEVIRDRAEGIEPESNRIDCGFEIVQRESA